MTTVVSLVSVISFRFGCFGALVLVVLVVSFSCFGLVHAVTFQTSQVGKDKLKQRQQGIKDKLHGVGKDEDVLLAREERIKNYRHFYMFRWFRRFRSAVPGFSTCHHKHP